MPVDRSTTLLAGSAFLVCVAFATAGALLGYLAGRGTAPAAVVVPDAPPASPAATPAAAPAAAPSLPAEHAAGVRVSSDLGAPDWSALAGSGIVFALARASAGSSFTDPAFAANWVGMREAGLRRGAYHVYYPEQDPLAQAEHFAGVVAALRAHDLPPVVSLPDTPGGDPAAFAAGLAEHLERLQTRTGRRVVVRLAQASTEARLAELLRAHALWLEQPADGDPATGTAGFVALRDDLDLHGRALPLQVFTGSPAQLGEFVAGSVIGAPRPAEAPATAAPPAASAAPEPVAAAPPPAGLEPPAGAAGDALLGVAVSHYQGLVVWPALREAGAAFGYARASAGGHFIDPQFQNNWEGMRAAGITRGAYHLLYADEDAARQADLFVAVAQAMRPNDLPPAVVVADAGFDPAQAAAGLRVWLQRVRAKLERVPVVLGTASRHRQWSDAALPAYAPWLARPAGEGPPEAGTAWTFWRYATDAHVDGVPGALEASVFRGGASALREYIARSGEATGPADAQPPRPAASTASPAPAATPDAPASIAPATPAETAPASSPPAPAATQGTQAAAPVPAETQRTYTVTRGDTLFSISRRHGVTVDALIEANAIDDVGRLEVGRVLRIP